MTEGKKIVDEDLIKQGLTPETRGRKRRTYGEKYEEISLSEGTKRASQSLVVTLPTAKSRGCGRTPASAAAQKGQVQLLVKATFAGSVRESVGFIGYGLLLRPILEERRHREADEVLYWGTVEVLCWGMVEVLCWEVLTSSRRSSSEQSEEGFHRSDDHCFSLGMSSC